MKALAKLALLLGIAVSTWGLAQVAAAAEPAKLRVISTLFPYHDWARVIGGDRVESTLLLPPGVEAHSFDPTPRDIARMRQCDIFVYTGPYMEPWAEDLVADAARRGVGVVEAGDFVDLFAGAGEGQGEAGAAGKGAPPHGHDDKGHADHDDHGHDDHGHGKEAARHGHETSAHDDDHGHHHGDVDPHIWLEFGNAARIVAGMARAFAAKDPENAQYFAERAAAYAESLRQLDERYAAGLATCRQRTIIYGGHFAFGYAARRYDLTHVSPYKGFSPNAEPSPRDIAELTRRMKKEGHSHIFYEEGIDPKVARVISGETGAGMLLLHGAHNVGRKELDEGVTYLKLMNDNLERLREGLQCR